jgi:hypothetical protein
MIVSLLLVQLAMCSAILWKELVVNKFRRIATSIFFCFYLLVYIIEPLVIHLFYGGPRSIIRDSTAVIADDYVFFVFNVLGIALLASAWVLSRTSLAPVAPTPAGRTIDARLLGLKNPLGLMIPVGFWLFYKSTGLSMAELLIASRFAWFESAGYNGVLAVAAAYLIALTPVYFLLFLESRDRGWQDYAVMALVVGALLMYGIVTKDRKWIFYLLSGWLASAYLRGGRTIRIGTKGKILLGSVMVVILLSQILRDILPQLLLNENSTAGEGFGKSLSRIFVESDLAYFYSASVEAIHQNVNHGFYITLGLVRRLLFFYLPTSISFGLKVEDMSAVFSDVVSGGDEVRRGNMPPGLFGLFVLSFGFVSSVFLMPLLAGLLRLLDQLVLRPLGLVTVNALSFLVVGVVFFFRGDESTVIYFPIFNLLVTAMLSTGARIFRGATWRK